MPRLVPIRCPDCQAPMTVGPRQDVVQCSYCGTSCFVQRPKAPPPVMPPPVHGGPKTAVIYVPHQQSSSPAAAVVGVLAVVVVAGIATWILMLDEPSQPAQQQLISDVSTPEPTLDEVEEDDTSDSPADEDSYEEPEVEKAKPPTHPARPIAVPPPPPPPPPSNSPCGCPPNDLMCAMRCSK